MTVADSRQGVSRGSPRRLLESWSRIRYDSCHWIAQKMCRLFGFRSSVQSGTHRSLVEAENALVEQSEAHSDGWGMAYYIDRDAYILKSDVAAHNCERFQLASSRLQ